MLLKQPLQPSSERSSNSNRLSHILSWNAWVIPFASSRLASRPVLQGREAARLLDSEWNSNPGLVVVCMQELWGWHVGIGKIFLLISPALDSFQGCLRRIPGGIYFSEFVGLTFIILFFLTGFLFRLISWLPFYDYFFVWNPRTLFASSLRSTPLIHSIGISTPIRLIDSGLFMMANRRPIKEGFVPFEQKSCGDEEFMANKGILWAFFAQPEREPSNLDSKTTSFNHGTLVLNAHCRRTWDEIESNRYAAEIANMVMISFRFYSYHTSSTLISF
jgi:hypothetical protein